MHELGGSLLLCIYAIYLNEGYFTICTLFFFSNKLSIVGKDIVMNDESTLISFTEFTMKSTEP